MEENKKEEPQFNPELIGFGLDENGFLCTSIHISKGPRELLGFFMQMEDWVKAYFAKKLMEEQNKKLVRPENGFLKGFKNKWGR